MDKHIGAQFYTIAKSIQTLPDFEESCKKISDMGFKIVQISGTPLKASDMRPILDKYGLKVVTTHRGFQDFKNNIEEVIEYNKILGSDICGMGMMPLEFVESEEKLSEFIKEINKICETLKANNMYFGYHNHAWEFEKLGGKVIYDRLIEETDPEVFQFIVDIAWVHLAVNDTPALLKRLGKRAMAIHLKDYAVLRENSVMTKVREIGNGFIHWDPILSACEEAGARFALIEQDCDFRTDDPFESLKESRDFLISKGYC